MTSTPESLLAAGRPREALIALQAQVRERAADARLRVFLFQLLCVLGQWDRALKQLELCGEMDAANLAMVAVYRDAVQCEPLRAAVFAGKATPIVLGQPAPWIASLIEALQADGRGENALAAQLRSDALNAAEPIAGTVNGTPFEWIADADARLGPVVEAVVNGRYQWIPIAALSRIKLEAPTDLRDLVWAPAQLTLANAAEIVALLPVRYAGTVDDEDDSLLMARKTEWIEHSPEQFAGLGQRLFSTDASEIGLLEVRELSFTAAAASEPLH